MTSVRFLAGVSGLIGLLAAAALAAQDRNRPAGASAFDPDIQPDTPHQLGDLWAFGAILDVDLIGEWDPDLDSSAADDRMTVEPRLELAFAYDADEAFEGFAEVELRRGVVIRDEVDSLDPQLELRLEQAYLLFDEFRPGYSFQVGRQEFEDDRLWWYDEELDAARLFFRSGPFGVEVSAARNPAFGNDLLDRERTDDSDNYLLVGRYAYAADAELNAYLVAQRDDIADAEPIFLGARSIGAIGPGLEHWIDLAVVRGSDGGRDIRAYGFDAGLEYETGLPGELELTVGVAFGSGDDEPGDAVVRDFRQTGLQGSYFYYGEVLAPELSNMWITTAGIGVSPAESVSVDVLYHRYRQHEASAAFRDVLLDAAPNGVDRDVGQALDVAAAWWGADDVEVQLILGSFFPGKAFTDRDNAYFGEVIVTYWF